MPQGGNCMKRRTPISLVTEENATPAARRAVEAHLATGQKMTNMKRTLLHNVPLFEMMNTAMDTVNGQLRGRIPRRAMLLYLYSIAAGNDCAVCGGVFRRVLSEMGIDDPAGLDLTEEERDLVDFARALTADGNHIPDEVYERLQRRYDEETLVVLVMNGVFSMASNYFNNITGVEPDG